MEIDIFFYDQTNPVFVFSDQDDFFTRTLYLQIKTEVNDLCYLVEWF